MNLRKAEITRETQLGERSHGTMYLGDARDLMPELISRYAGRVQLIYIDPPFATGQTFSMRVRVGEKEWRTGSGSLVQTAFNDRFEPEEYLDMMHTLLTGARTLLRDTGVLYLHVDWRMHARLRIIMDEIFGEQNFLNEIIWSYQTGGRARNFYSRKHDVILFYRKSKKYYFNLEAVPIARTDSRRNHMRKHTDADGRVYRSIKSGGKVYTYYDDEPAYPGDVWDDVSHLQQKDPQRTGYDTQKPLRLMERIILSSSRPGDLVCDLCTGSGTTLEAAMLHNRSFLGVDVSPLAMQVARRRLTDANATYIAQPCAGNPDVDATIVPAIAYYEITLNRYQVEPGVSARAFSGMDAVDGWSAGYLRDGEFFSLAHALRTRHHPALVTRLEIPVLEGEPCIRISDVLGRFFYYVLPLNGTV